MRRTTFVIFNKVTKSYVSGPNSLTKKKSKAKKFNSYDVAERECARDESPQRLS